LLDEDGVLSHSVKGVVLDLVSLVRQECEHLAQSEILLGFLPHPEVRKKLPLIYHNSLDPCVTVLEVIFLSRGHLEDTGLTEDHISFYLQLLQIVQVLLELEALLALRNHDFDKC